MATKTRAAAGLAAVAIAAGLPTGCSPVDEPGSRGSRPPSTGSTADVDEHLEELERDMVEDTRRGHYGPGEYSAVCDEHDRVLIYRPLTRWARKQAHLDCPNGTAPDADPTGSADARP